MLLRKAFTLFGRSSPNSRRLMLNSLSYFAFASSNKNFYQVLGVPQNASQSEIKAAYYKLAKQYHPDVNKGNEERFKEISTAYETLSASDKRKNYDDMLKYGGGGSSYSGQGQQQSWQQQYQQYQQQYRNQYQQQQQSQSGGDATGRRKGFWEQYTEYYYDPSTGKYKTKANSQFYEDPNTAYYRQHQTFKEKQEYRDFKKRMEEEFRKAQEVFQIFS